MFVQVNMAKYNTGKRTIKKGYKDFEVRDEFWDKLVEFAEKDFVSKLWEDGKIVRTHRTIEFDDFINTIARTEQELQIVDDLRYCMWGSTVTIENTYISDTLVKFVAEVNDNYATFYSNKTGKPFQVQIADRLVGKLKKGDEVVIHILMNKKWVIVDVISDE